jgi:O-antigen ligase
VAHNIYVQVGAAIGLVALAGFVTMLLWLLLPLFTRTRPPAYRLAYPALAYVLVGPLTDTLADTSMWAAVSLAMLAFPERSQP